MKFISDAQANYNIAQQHLADLTGTQAPSLIGGPYTPFAHLESSPYSAPPVNLQNLTPSADQPPAQKFTTPHWNPNGQQIRPFDSIVPSINK